jgi:transcriptional regulator with XRE-family HTH domain
MEDLPLSGEPLRARLREVGLNMSTLADALGIRPQAVHKWVNGGSSPSAKYIPQLLELLHLQLDTVADNERLARLEQDVSRLRDEVRDVTELLRRLGNQQLGADVAPTATPTDSTRRRSRP